MNDVGAARALRLLRLGPSPLCGGRMCDSGWCCTPARVALQVCAAGEAGAKPGWQMQAERRRRDGPGGESRSARAAELRKVALEKVMWLVLGGVAFVAALKARDSARALHVGRWALAVLMIAFGAAVNTAYLVLSPDYYASFADASFEFVRSTGASLVLPNQVFFIGLLIIAEGTAGVLLLRAGRSTQIALVALIGFHIGQLAFGGVMWVWAPLMLVTLILLLQAERHADDARQPHTTPVKDVAV